MADIQMETILGHQASLLEVLGIIQKVCCCFINRELQLVVANIDLLLQMLQGVTIILAAVAVS